ncbi:hypothetical protein GUY40_25340 [Pseudomonas sp. R5(2019)]|nr:hypothetical protein [Pseudomonas sp. R5(2019)]
MEQVPLVEKQIAHFWPYRRLPAPPCDKARPRLVVEDAKKTAKEEIGSLFAATASHTGFRGHIISERSQKGDD